MGNLNPIQSDDFQYIFKPIKLELSWTGLRRFILDWIETSRLIISR